MYMDMDMDMDMALFMARDMDEPAGCGSCEGGAFFLFL